MIFLGTWDTVFVVAVGQLVAFAEKATKEYSLLLANHTLISRMRAEDGTSMGYNLHITRKEFWTDEEGPEISLAEWKRYVQGDPDVEADPDNPGGESYVFCGHQERWPLWWNEQGEVYTKNPEPEVIAKLVQIARALDAKVFGDDGEIYGVDLADPTKFEAR